MTFIRGFRHFVCYLLLSTASLAFGQSTFGSVRGVAQDITGAVIPDTRIVLHSVDENTDRDVAADGSGNFILENVKAGKYTLHASKAGFADTVVSGNLRRRSPGFAAHGYAQPGGTIRHGSSDFG